MDYFCLFLAIFLLFNSNVSFICTSFGTWDKICVWVVLRNELFLLDLFLLIYSFFFFFSSFCSCSISSSFNSYIKPCMFLYCKVDKSFKNWVIETCFLIRLKNLVGEEISSYECDGYFVSSSFIFFFFLTYWSDLSWA